MNDELELLRAISRDPESNDPRLVYADWLEECGQTAEAEFIRVQCELAEVPMDDERWPDLVFRESQVAQTAEPNLLERLERELKIGFAEQTFRFKRGLPYGVTPDGAFLRRLMKPSPHLSELGRDITILDFLPIREIQLPEDNGQRLLLWNSLVNSTQHSFSIKQNDAYLSPRIPVVNNVHAIESVQVKTVSQIKFLDEHLPRLERVGLTIEDGLLARSLTQSDLFAKLDSLKIRLSSGRQVKDLGHAGLTPPQLRKLCVNTNAGFDLLTSPVAAHSRCCEISLRTPQEYLWARFFQSDFANQLLDLKITMEEFLPLNPFVLEGNVVPKLRRLDIYGGVVRPNWEPLERLVELNVREWSNKDIVPVLTQRRLESLVKLSLGRQAANGGEMVEALRASPGMPRLRHLDMMGIYLRPVALARLLRSTLVEQLTSLQLEVAPTAETFEVLMRCKSLRPDIKLRVASNVFGQWPWADDERQEMKERFPNLQLST